MLTKSEITRVRSISDKRFRDLEDIFLAEGVKLVGELLESDLEVEQVYATAKGISQLNVKSGKITEVSPKEIERLSQLKTASQVVAIVRKPHYTLTQPCATDLTLVLDRVQDPGNLGTIIRLADWFGIRDIVCSPDSADCYSPKVIQATMGAILRVRLHYTDLTNYLSEATKQNTPIYGTYLEGNNIYTESLTLGGIIIMGNEGSGISSTLTPFVSHKLYIPPFPADRSSGSESLNVAIATSIICSEFRRR